MKNYIIPFILMVGLLFLAGCSSGPIQAYPPTSPEGLTLMDHSRSRVNAIYLREGADLSTYDQVQLLDPQVAFKVGWQERVNQQQRIGQISDQDMDKMAAKGKELLIMEFTRALESGGYKIVGRAGPNVLGLKAYLRELDVYAPNPNNMENPYSQTYTRGGGDATLTLEIYDSMTGQLLARVIDRKAGYDNPKGDRSVRSQESNIEDTRLAFANWARMLAEGLNLLNSGKIILQPRVSQ